MKWSRTPLLFVVVPILVWIAACGGPTPVSAPLEYVATATSATTVKVVFSQPVDVGSEVPANYALTGPAGPVEVHYASRTGDGSVVLLATDTLVSGAMYSLEVEGVMAGQGATLGTAASSFGGTSERAPIVASAIALSHTEVLVTFAEPNPGSVATMSDSALNPAFYDIVEDAPALDETPDLTIERIEFARDAKGNPDRGRVVLHTEGQLDTGYTLRVTNVVSAAGDKLIDPENATAIFRGIPAIDDVGPAVTGAVSISNTQVLVSFSEPVLDANRADRYTIVDDALADLAVTAAAYANPYQTQVLLTTAPQADERTTYTLTVTGVTDRQANAIDPSANTATFQGTFRTGPIAGDTTPPRVSNTGSTGNTTVLVTFTEPIDRTSAEVPQHYHISASLGTGEIATQAVLTVVSAALSNDRTTVTLTTLSQSDLLYTLEVTNVKDLAGNQIAPPERLVDPSSVTFQGTAPNGTQPDSDCDGLSDTLEQRGWVVRVVNTDGSTRSYEVTSDPGTPGLDCAANAASADTDGDGLDDFNERVYVTDPRNEDTDGDALTDARELNEIYSEPTMQDTDGDGLGDGLEVDFFFTSPLFEDTDGDQLLDGDEVATQNRNPLIADLPAFDMRVVGDVQLGLDVRFTAESADGTRVLDTRNSQSSLTTSSSRTSGSANSNATEWFINAGAKAGIEYEPPFDFKFSGEVSIDGGYKEGNTTAFTSESVRATQQEQAASRSTEREVERGETVTREVLGATMAVALELESLGDIAFTVDNIEVTAKLVDPRDPTVFVPIATLTSAGSGAITLGPAPDARGPFRFVANDPAPALVEALRENPRNLLFQVANYDIVDEFGRNFSFTYQDVNDRTAQLFIDYGGRRASELKRVATQSAFDGSGAAVGVSMQTVLEQILGLEFVPESEDPALIACLDGTSTVACSSADRARILNSYSVRTESGITNLSRIRSVVTNVADGYRWFVDVELPPGTVEPDSIRDLVVTSGRSFRFLYGQDLDGDGLTVQQEAFYGSIDARTDVLRNACFGNPAETGCNDSDGIPDSRDTDRDGLDDNVEVFGRELSPDPVSDDDYEPWQVVVRGEDATTTSSSPSRFDTDGDGLTDCQELGLCDVYVYLYPNGSTDTPAADQVALRSTLEANPQSGAVARLYRDASGRPSIFGSIAPAWTLLRSSDGRIDPSRFDTDGDGISDAGELVGVRYLPLDAAPGASLLQLFPGYGNLPSRTVRLASLSDVATDPLNADSDGDLLGDGLETQIGIDPTDPNSTGDAALDDDGDGLRNIEEDFGWVVVYRNAAGTWVDAAGSPLRVNGANQLLDTLGNPVPTDGFGNPLSTVNLRLADGVTLPVRVPSDRNQADADLDGLDDAVERALFSHPGRFDTDGDELGDGAEANGVAFASDTVDPVRFTNPLAWDTDRDGRSDGAEVRDSWIVAVSGETPYKVFSDPLIDDADLDGLRDAAEALQLTDPGLADTDGDGVEDWDELNSPLLTGGLTRDPLVPDQIVEFRYSNFTVLDSCYLIPGEASLDGWQVASNGWYTDLRYSRFGGNPDGYLWLRAGSFFTAQPNLLTLVAPAEYRGDLSAYYGGSYQFDLREFQRDGDQTRFDPNVRITGRTDADVAITIVYDTAVHESTSWTTVSVPLSVASDGSGGFVDLDVWRKANGDDVTEAEFEDLLGNVESVVITGSYEAPQRFFDFLYGGVGFDNPTLAAPGAVAIENGFDDGALSAGNFRGKLNLELPQADGSLSVLDGMVNFGTIGSLTVGSTVALVSDPAVVRFVLGRDQSARAFSTTIFEESEAFTLGIDVNAVANYGNVSNRYEYPVVGGADSVILRGEKPEQTSDTCEIAISWTWRVVQ